MAKRGFRRCALLLSGILAFSNVASAAEMGVNTHMAHTTVAGYGPIITTETAKKANFGWIREVFPWGQGSSHSYNAVETTKGERKIPKRMEEAVEEAKKNDLNMLVVLTGGNVNYTLSDGETHPQSNTMPTSADTDYFNGYIEYVKFVAEYMKNEAKMPVRAYEIWNEPNLADMTANVDLEEYGKLYVAARNAIHSVDDEAIVLCGAVAGPTNTDVAAILKSVSENGGIDKIDAFSIHEYWEDPENEITGYLSGLNSILPELDQYDYYGPVWMTETGGATTTYSADELAKLQIRWVSTFEYWLKNNASNRDGKTFERDGNYFIYDLRNDGTDPTNEQQNFGLVDFDYNPNPSYLTMQRYNQLMSDKEFVSREVSSNKYTYTYNNATTNEKAYVVYATSGSDSVNVPASGDVMYVYNYKGELIDTKTAPSGTVSIDVDASPKMIECVNYQSTIDSISYDSDKNVVNISGSYEHGDEVSITLTAGEVTQTVKAKVENGEFRTFFSPNADGNYTVTVAKEEITALGQSEGWATSNLDVQKNVADESNSIADGAVVVKDGTKITVSASVSNYVAGDSATALVIPKGIDPQTAPADKIVYIGQVKLDNAGFTFSIDAPAIGEYTVYLSASRATGATDNTVGTAETFQYVRVADMDINENGTNAETNKAKVKATANLTNFNTEKKNAVFLIAQYAGGRLLDVKTKSAEVLPNTFRAEPFEFEVDKFDGATTISVLAWDSLSGIRPLAPKVNLGE